MDVIIWDELSFILSSTLQSLIHPLTGFAQGIFFSVSTNFTNLIFFGANSFELGPTWPNLPKYSKCSFLQPCLRGCFNVIFKTE